MVTTVMVILKEVVHLVEHGRILQVAAALLSSGPNPAQHF